MDIQQAYIANIQADFLYFCDYVHNHGRKPDNLAWHPSKLHKFLCRTVQEFVERPAKGSFEILILNTPPQVGKSTTITETFPAWWQMKNPDAGIIEVSYGDDLAERFGKANKEKAKEFGHLFGVELDPEKQTAKEFKIKGHQGRTISRGYGSALTGFTGNLIIVDDPVKNAVEADSERDRNKKWADFERSIKTRLGAGDKLILIMTRWHEDDLAGRIMEIYADRTTVINIPCECDSEDDPLGRKIGEAICPEVGKDDVWLKDFKKTLKSQEGVRTWNALYQGRPVALEGNMIKRNWWKYYDSNEFWAGVKKGTILIDKMIMSVDASFKDNDDNDYVAIEVWAKVGIDYYLIDLRNEHLNFLGTVNAIKRTKVDYPMISDILIEDKANGTAAIQVLRSQILGIIAVEPEKSKEARVNPITFVIESGHCHLPKDKDFTWGFVEQCAAFPNGKNDDMVDAMSQALIRLIFKKSFRRAMREIESSLFHRKPRRSNGIGKGDRITII